MIPDPRRAPASFALSDASGKVTSSGEAEAMIGDDAVSVGPVTVSYLDADGLDAADYRITLDLWPGGRLVLAQLGRRFDTFTQELRRIRNRARVAGLLAHGVTMPEVFQGAVLANGRQRPAEFQVYDTHVTVVPEDGDPWQLPLGALTSVSTQESPPAVVLERVGGATLLGQLGRRRDACLAAIRERREAQRRLLADLTEQEGFADGWGVARGTVRGFDELVARFTAGARVDAARAVLAAATGEPRVGFVQLLDPDAEQLASPSALPDNWASFVLAPVGGLTVLEILAGPAAATYVFRGDVDEVNRDLQLLHFRRAPLALTPEQAEVTPENPHRLALRRLAPLQRLRAMSVARIIHNEGWWSALKAALA